MAVLSKSPKRPQFWLEKEVTPPKPSRKEVNAASWVYDPYSPRIVKKPVDGDDV